MRTASLLRISNRDRISLDLLGTFPDEGA